MALMRGATSVHDGVVHWWRSCEAPVGAFAIGPSTALGHAVALWVLLCGFAARLRHRLAATLRTALPVAAAWMHARDNMRGILHAICAVALLLRGHRGRAAGRGCGRGCSPPTAASSGGT